MGNERGEAVVVAEADLVIGDGVVLVDHGHDAEGEQALERLAGVEVLLTVPEVERSQQDLARNEAVGGEHHVPRRHQPVLAHGRHRLERGQIGRTPPPEDFGQGRQPGADRARAHHHDLVAVGDGIGHLPASLAMTCWSRRPDSSVSEEVPILTTTLIRRSRT